MVTVSVGRNLNSPQFFGARPYFAVINGTANTGREIIRVFANDSDTDVSLFVWKTYITSYRRLLLIPPNFKTKHMGTITWHYLLI